MMGTELGLRTGLSACKEVLFEPRVFRMRIVPGRGAPSDPRSPVVDATRVVGIHLFLIQCKGA